MNFVCMYKNKKDLRGSEFAKRVALCLLKQLKTCSYSVSGRDLADILCI